MQVYNTSDFTQKFMPLDKLQSLFHGDYSDFFIVRVEEMYRHVSRAVPPVKVTNHTCIYLTEGESYMRIGSAEHTIRSGELLFVPAGQIFSFEPYDESKYQRGYLFNFNEQAMLGRYTQPQLLQEFDFLKVWGNYKVTPGESLSVHLRHLLERIFEYYLQHGFSKPTLIQTYLLAFLCEVNQAYQPLSNYKLTAAITLTNNFRELLTAHIQTHQRVSDYAVLLHVSPNHLNKAVKKVTGKSPTLWIDEMLIAEAKVWLYQTRISISEVASAIGLQDASYFSRLFKRYEGQTPAEYRKRIEIS